MTYHLSSIKKYYKTSQNGLTFFFKPLVLTLKYKNTMKTIRQKQTSILNTNSQAKCGKRVREENLPFPSKKIQQKLSAVKRLNIHTHTHTHTHKNERDYLGFFFYILNILNLNFFFLFSYSSAGGGCVFLSL